MRFEASVTSVSWIPSEAVPGTMKLPMFVGLTEYDPPPPDVITDLDALHAARRFRFANRLRAWIEVDEHGRIADAGYRGGGLLGATVLHLPGGRDRVLENTPFPDLQRVPERSTDRVRFVQTTGGRTNAPMPRRVDRPPFVQITSPTVWTTLALTLHADGRSEFEVLGASPFPRHWFYDDAGRLVKKSSLADFRTWAATNHGDRSPWHDHDEEALIADAESELERQLSGLIMRGGERPAIRRIKRGAHLTEQGEQGDELYLVLDGLFDVEVDGELVAEVGPGAIVGERATLEGKVRTSTLRARTRCRVAVARADQLDREVLTALSQGHRREELARGSDVIS